MKCLRVAIVALWFVVAAACTSTESGNPTARGRDADAGEREEDGDGVVRVGFESGGPPVEGGISDEDDENENDGG